MSSFLCFICHSTLDCDTNEETREKYREVIGICLCPDHHLCHICIHILNKLVLFRSICLKRSLEYPVLFSEKGVINLERTDIDLQILCSDEMCQDISNRMFYQIKYEQYGSNDNSQNYEQEYIKLEEDCDHINTDNISLTLDDNERRDCCDSNIISKLDYKEIDEMENDYERKGYTNNDDHSNFNEVSQSNQGRDDLEKEIGNLNQVEVKRKSKKSKKRGFVKIILNLEQQKAELEANRREKKYLESEYKCYNCALGFLFKDTYQAHMMRHEESNGEHRCVLCTLRFATPAVLRSHTSLHAERYRCSRCEALLRPRARAKHTAGCLRSETSDYVACHLCANLFKDASGLQQHLRRGHSSKTSRVHRCSVCGEACRNQAAVRTHMLKHLKKKFACDQCSAVYSSPYTLNQHKKTHQMGQERHFCTACGVSYSTRKSLMAHRRNSLKHQQTVFECNKCSRVLPHRRALEAHERKAHLGMLGAPPQTQGSRRTSAERRVCHLCGKSFKGNSKLNRHLREVCEKMKLDGQPASDYE